MTKEEKAEITDLTKCNFKQMAAYFKDLSERRKNKTKEEKQVSSMKQIAGLILVLCLANERRCYFVTMSVIDWLQA